MAKSIILEHEEEVKVVNELTNIDIDISILVKFQEMMNRENKNY